VRRERGYLSAIKHAMLASAVDRATAQDRHFAPTR
jgi:hypothetical protein